MEKLLIVILAKSYKPHGRCIAGRLVKYVEDNKVEIGSWVRPVANDHTGHGALQEKMYEYEDGTEVRVLDIVEIPIIKHFPIDGQPENYVIDESKKWKKISSLNPTFIQSISDNVESIWNDPQAPSSHIVTAHYDQQGLIKQSLCLIKPSSLLITLSNDFNSFDESYKKKITASFIYKGVYYDKISVTCPSIRKALSNKYPREGSESVTIPLLKMDNYLLCMSLAPRFGINDHHYKLVATVFDFDGYLQRTYIA